MSAVLGYGPERVGGHTLEEIKDFTPGRRLHPRRNEMICELRAAGVPLGVLACLFKVTYKALHEICYGIEPPQSPEQTVLFPQPEESNGYCLVIEDVRQRNRGLDDETRRAIAELYANNPDWVGQVHRIRGAPRPGTVMQNRRIRVGY